MVKIEINEDQLKKAIQQLPADRRARLLESLEQSTWETRFKRLLSRIDARLKKSPISQKQISKIVEEARDEYYARSRP